MSVSPAGNQPLSLRIFPSEESHKRLLLDFDSKVPRPRYSRWKGKNIFLCGGTVILGVHWNHLVVSTAILIVSWVEYAGLVIPFTHRDILYAVALAKGTIDLLLLISVATSDPGIQPRQLFKNEKSTSVTLIRKDAAALKSSFCKICNIWRPPRARHCRFCDNCVDVFDHHCPWTGTCIGVRNYPQFFALMLSIVLSALILLLTTLHIGLGWLLAGANTDQYVLRAVVVAVNLLWSCTVLVMVGTLFAFHVYLGLRGQTTNEYFRERRARQQRQPALTAPTAVTVCCAPCLLPYAACKVLRVTGTSSSTNATASTEEVQPSVLSADATAGSTQLTSSGAQGIAQGIASAGSVAPSPTSGLELALTPLYEPDSTPFPQLSPSPSSPPLSLGSLANSPFPSTAAAGQEQAGREPVLDTIPEDGDHTVTSESNPLRPQSLRSIRSTDPGSREAVRAVYDSYSPLPLGDGGATTPEHTETEVRVRCCCLCRCRSVPCPCCVPASRLLPQWQVEGEADAQQQEELLQVLFERMTAALRRLEVDRVLRGDVSV